MWPRTYFLLFDHPVAPSLRGRTAGRPSRSPSDSRARSHRDGGPIDPQRLRELQEHQQNAQISRLMFGLADYGDRTCCKVNHGSARRSQQQRSQPAATAGSNDDKIGVVRFLQQGFGWRVFREL